MKRYAYKALAADGESVTGEMDAADERAVVDKLQLSGLLPVSTNELSVGAFDKEISFLSRGGTNSNDIYSFTRELATMLNAGLPLSHALTTLESLATKPMLRQMLERIRGSVEGGSALSEAISDCGGPFSNFYVGLLRAGEASGTIELVLTRLAEYQLRTKQLREVILSALLYPAILFVVAGSALIVLLIYVVPQFVPLFDDLGSSLPWSTEIVIGAAEIVSNSWWLVLALITGVYLSARKLLAEPRLRIKFDRFLLSLPLFGELLVRIELTIMCRTLGTLTNNGVALLDGVRLVRDTTSNAVIGEALSVVADELERGKGLSQPMSDAKCFPELAIQLIRVGEETGALADMLLRLADIYDVEAQNTIKRLLALLEPVLILGMGLLIAFIVISILLALLSLNDLVI